MNWIIGTLLVLFSAAGRKPGLVEGDARISPTRPTVTTVRSASDAASTNAAYKSAIGVGASC